MRRKFALGLFPVCIAFAFFPMLQLIYYASLDGFLERANVWAALGFMLAPNLLAWVLGAFVGPKMKPVFHVIPVVGLSAAIAWFLAVKVGLFWFGAAVWGVALTASSVLTAFKVYSGNPDVTMSHIAFFGLVFFGVEQVVGSILGEGYHRIYAQNALADIRPIAVFWLLAVIWIAVYFHAQSLNASRGRKTPRRVMIFNIVSAGVFTLVVLGVYHIDALKNAVATVLVGVLYVFGLVSELMAKLLGMEEPTGEIGDGGGMDDIGAALDADPHVENLFDVIFMRFMLVVVILLLVAAAVFLTWQLIRFIRHIIRRMNGFLNSWESTNQSYMDEQEDLMNAQIFRQEMAERAERIRRRFRRRPRLDELPDDRARVRTLYRWMLERSARKGEYDASKTSREFLGGRYEGGEGLAFSEAYDRARYSEHEPAPEDVKAGEALYRRQ